MATAPFPSFYSPPYAYSSTTTYPPPPYPGGYYTSPFPYAASYSYPPSAAACTPAAGFSPAPAYGPPTAISAPTTIGPFPYESPCPTNEPTPIHTKAEPNWPPPAPDPTTSTPSCCWPSSTTTPVPPPHPATARRAAPPSWSADLAQQLKLAHRSLLNINRRLDEYAESQGSVASLQGKLYKLADRLATPRVSSSASSTTTVPTQSVEFAPSPGSKAVAASALSKFCAEASSSASSVSSPSGASATTDAVPQMFDDMPQQYGLNNLERRSLFRADGTEHNYFTLPADYSLERAVSEPVFDVYDDESSVCSNESVHVFTGTPEQHTYEEIQQEGEQEPTCMSKPSEFTLSDNDDVYGATYIKFRYGQCIREISGLDFSPGCALGDEANKWNMLLTEEGREDWDPGILKTIMVVPPVVKWFSLEDVMPTHVPHVFVDVSIKCSERNSKTKLPSLTDSELCGKHWKRQHGNNPQRFMLTTEVRRKEWDPGILNQMDMMLVFSATGMEGPKNHLANKELRDNTSTKVAALTWHSSLPGTPFILILSSSTYTWDPGVLTMIGMMLDKYAMSHESQFTHWSTEFLVLSSTACMQYVPPNGMYSVLPATCFLLQRAAHLSQGNCLCSLYCNSVLNTEYCTERMQWDPGVTVSLYCWLDTLTIWSEIVTPFFCTHILELATCQNQVISASYVWDPGTMLLQHKSILLPNGSELRDGQLAHMPQSPTINSSEFRRHMFTELSRCLSSFKNRVKLQWDPGIAFIHQQGEQKNYNAKPVGYLHTSIFFNTFLPP